MPILGIIASSISGNLDAGDFESIATVSVGSGGSSTITFSSIPSTFSHLQIRYMARSNRNVNDGEYVLMRFNGINSTASYYGQHYVRGNGSAVLAAADGTANTSYIERLPALNTLSSVFGAGIIDILDYKDTNKNKVWRHLGGYDANGDTAANIRISSGMLLSTPAISSISFVPGEGTIFTQYSHFALYGIRT
jgi:hypothetical protein